MSVCVSIYLCLCIYYLSMCLCIYLPIYSCVYLCSHLPLCVFLYHPSVKSLCLSIQLLYLNAADRLAYRLQKFNFRIPEAGSPKFRIEDASSLTSALFLVHRQALLAVTSNGGRETELSGVSSLLLLLLLSRFRRVRLCATPETVAHQAPPSLGFSR